MLLTTITTIGGLLPVLLNISGGTEFWHPITAAVVFDPAFATALTLLVIPVCYSVAYSIRPAAATVPERLGMKQTPAT